MSKFYLLFYKFSTKTKQGFHNWEKKIPNLIFKPYKRHISWFSEMLAFSRMCEQRYQQSCWNLLKPKWALRLLGAAGSS